MPNPHARRLRRDATDAERALWRALRDRQLAGHKFRRQHPLLPGVIVDFACPAHRLVVEADGGQHDPATDAARTARITAAGWRVVRFWNDEILANPEGVVLAILAALGAQPRRHRRGPHPGPLPQAGEGEAAALSHATPPLPQTGAGEAAAAAHATPPLPLAGEGWGEG